MRRATSVVLGLLLVLGTSLSGPGHLHAASGDERSGGLHVDHVHLDSDHYEHHSDPDTDLDHAADHRGDDAVGLIWTGSEAKPKLALPCLEAVVASEEPPETPYTVRQACSGEPPRDPPHLTRPPGRAPPA